eukprot:71089-Pyramimonas_sp.AAC.1
MQGGGRSNAGTAPLTLTRAGLAVRCFFFFQLAANAEVCVRRIKPIVGLSVAGLPQGAMYLMVHVDFASFHEGAYSSSTNNIKSLLLIIMLNNVK